MARRWGRAVLIIVLGALAAAAGAFWAWRTWLVPRFEAAGIAIDPQARVDPQRQYELVVWEEAIVVPWAEADHRSVLDEAVAAFTERRPNVRVSYSLLDPLQARDQLAAAVAAGRPPDVYGTAAGLILHPSHQIPAEPYFPGTGRGELPPFLPAATGGLTRDGIVWAWPRALWWSVWLADPELLARGGVDVDAVLVRGWTWDDVLQLAERLREAVADPLVLDAASVPTLAELVLNAGAPVPPHPPEGVAGLQEALVRVARWLQTLREHGAVPGDPATASRTRLERLITGRTALIGPVGPHLAQAVLRRRPGRFLLVPIPHHPAAPETAPAVPSGYLVFRQDAYQGDDHTRLAMELASWLAARTETWLAETLGLLPARPATLHAWHDLAPLDARSKQFLAEYVLHAGSGAGAAFAAESLWDRAAPQWAAFWTDSPVPEEWAAAVVRDLLEGGPAP